MKPNVKYIFHNPEPTIFKLIFHIICIPCFFSAQNLNVKRPQGKLELSLKRQGFYTENNNHKR